MTINRRSFVRSAAAAVGGGASVAADAAAQSPLQLAQAGPFPQAAPPAPIPPGPYKPDYGENVGDQTQRYYLFLKDLFDPSKTLRDDVWNMRDRDLRDLLKTRLGLDLSYGSTKILIVDIGKGRVKFSDGSDCTVTGCVVTNPTTTSWYTLMLPPLPLQYKKADGTPEEGYLKEMTWESAWHHAIVYGYGM